MKFWDRVKKDLQTAVKESAELFKEGKTILAAEAKRMAEKGPAGMKAEAQKMVKEGVESAKKSASNVKAEAQRMARITSLRFQLFRLNEKAQEKFAEIGGQIYHAATKSKKSVRLHEKVRKLVLEAKQIEKLTKRLKSEIDRL
jgi:hypothetical protein